MSKLLFIFITATLILMPVARGNTDERVWTFKSGEKLRAAQLSFETESGEIVMLINNNEKRTIQFNDLSPIDQAWLVEWSQVEQEMDAFIGALGGTFEHRVAKGDEFETDYFIYTPASISTNANRPLLILFNAGGRAARYIKKFADAAELHGITVICSPQFLNSTDDEINDVMSRRFLEMLPIIEAKVPHDPKRLFMGGNSGGAMRAYGYTAEIDRPWAGIYANAGWLGGYDYYDLPYPGGMRIAMINGNNDHANRWLERDGKLLMSKGNEVAVFSFEGGHQPAPPKSRSKALEWLINENGQY